MSSCLLNSHINKLSTVMFLLKIFLAYIYNDPLIEIQQDLTAFPFRYINLIFSTEPLACMTMSLILRLAIIEMGISNSRFLFFSSTYPLVRIHSSNQESSL